MLADKADIKFSQLATCSYTEVMRPLNISRTMCY